MVTLRVLNFSFDSSFDFFFFEPHCLFFIKYFRGIFVLQLPSLFFFNRVYFYFFFKNKKSIKIFLNNLFFLNHLFFFLKLKVRGLGYRVKRITDNFFRFFLGTTNLFFFHVPRNILIRVRRRRMLLVSCDLSLLNLVFSHLLLLKKIIPYKLRGVFFPKQIILMKPGKKSF